MIVSDIDDVLIPRLGETFIGPPLIIVLPLCIVITILYAYLDEFRILASRYPSSAAGFSYNRYNTEVSL